MRAALCAIRCGNCAVLSLSSSICRRASLTGSTSSMSPTQGTRSWARFGRVLGLDEALEQGTLRLPGAELLTEAWRLAMARALRRKLRWPAHVKVLAIGGSTLGGSGKTPLAIACAAELARLGASPVLVGHAHRAAPGFARVVGGSDPVERVGDEALV